MSFIDVLKSLFEIALVAFTIWSLFHEDKYIAFEEKLFCRIKRKRLKRVHENRIFRPAAWNAFGMDKEGYGNS